MIEFATFKALRNHFHRHRFAWMRRSTAVLVLLLFYWGAQPSFPWFKGSLAASRLFSTIPLLDPLSGLEVILASRSFTGTLLLGITLVTVLYAILGRVFCAWVCPLGMILDLNESLRRRLNTLSRRFFHRPLPSLTLSRQLKYWLLAYFLLLSTWASLPVFTMISPIHWILWGLIFGATPWIGVILTLALVELAAPRVFCRSLCPLGAFYSLIGRAAPLRVPISQVEDCRLRCRLCDRQCPMGIEVMEKHTLAGHRSISDPECTRCGACIEVCPALVLETPQWVMPAAKSGH